MSEHNLIFWGNHYLITYTNWWIRYCYSSNANSHLLNKKISINNRILFMITWNIDEPGGVIKLIKHLAIYSIATELFGTLSLCLSFIPKFGIGKGLF